jgi:hypothetical protein
MAGKGHLLAEEWHDCRGFPVHQPTCRSSGTAMVDDRCYAWEEPLVRAIPYEEDILVVRLAVAEFAPAS